MQVQILDAYEQLGCRIQRSFLELRAVAAGDRRRVRVPHGHPPAADAAALRRLMREHDYDYLRQDMPELLRESGAGVQRVQDLKDFSHADEQEWMWADLHRGLDSTLNIVHNEIKYVADVERHYGEVPQVHLLGLAVEPGVHEPAGQLRACADRSQRAWPYRGHHRLHGS